jgi:hypothetical protein
MLRRISCFLFHRLQFFPSRLSSYYPCCYPFLLLNWPPLHAARLPYHPYHHHKYYRIPISICHIGFCFATCCLWLSIYFYF